ncbi:TetR family transcriptional regulator [Streptomyces sp. NPDC001985]|uniref:TetR/AcrR family transcriptional regulator n=1 Tax=Streptomyces sp. NPDC001985 TaxID=3154406 RepID=UPI003324C6DB
MPTEPEADGRRRRGEQRRRQLLDATVRVVHRGGPGAVTHRAVAAEAQVPKSVATYHFPSVDDLLTAALTDSADAYATELARTLPADSTPAELCAHLADHLNRRRERTLAEYELYLQAARRPALRPAAELWIALATRLAHRYTDDPATAAAFVAALDGATLHAVMRDEPLDPGRLTAVLTAVLAPGR